MRKIHLSLTVFILFTSFSFTSFSQEKITSPANGKAVIYFLRTTSLGGLMNFRFFEKEKFLGKFNGRNYIRYECEPGESMFWVKAENIDFVETNLSANKIYLVEANAVMGAFSSGVKFRLVDYSDEKQMKRIYKLFEKKDETVFIDGEIQEAQKNMGSIIQSGLLKIQKKQKKGKKIKRITLNMYYQE